MLADVRRSVYTGSDLAGNRRLGLAHGKVRVLRRIDGPHRGWRWLGRGAAFKVGSKLCGLHVFQMRERF
jgi:hypothetical protein